MIKLKPMVLEFFGGFAAAAMRAGQSGGSKKNKHFIDPKVAKVGDAVEYWGDYKELKLRATGVIKRIDSKGMEIGDLKQNANNKMNWHIGGKEINPTTYYIQFGPNKMLNRWKLKDA